MSGGLPVLELVVFQAGRTRFAIEARHVAGARTGGIPAGAERVLELSNGATMVVQEPISCVTIAADAIRPMPPLLALRSARRDIRAMFWDGDGPVFIADPR